MAKNVTCSECGHRGTIEQASDVWKCNCAAGTSSDPDCVCEAVNYADGAQEDNPPSNEGEVTALKARLAELEGADQ
jgi:hypothetical protein